MYAGREVFPNAALELVAAEIRFTYVPALTRDSARDAFADELRDIAPVTNLQDIGVVTLDGASARHETKKQFRIVNREKTLSIVLDPNRLVIETTRYTDFSAFSTIVARAIKALVQNSHVAGVERVGLRYIDEVRSPEPINAAQDWRGWVDDRLISVLGLRGDPAEMIQTVVQYSTGEDQHLRFRFGTVYGPSIVGGRGALKPRRDYGVERYFLLDFDSFWEAPDTIPPFDYKALIETIGRLHRPTGETFISSITEKLKNEVLRKEVSND